MAVPCRTDEGCLLEAAETVQSAIILYMGGKRRLLAQIELTRNLRVGTFCELTAEVDIHEIEPRTPFVGLEFLEGHRHFLSACLLVGIDVTTEIVVQLHVLCLHGHAHHYEQGEKNAFSHGYDMLFC